MKFYTMAWWRGTQPDAEHSYAGEDPFQAYGEHIAAVQDRIPGQFLAMASYVMLHDAKLLSLLYDCSTKTLQIEFRNYDPHRQEPGRFYLRYLDVSIFGSQADPDIGLGGPYGYGDLGYDEVDLTTDGQVEHRLLFSSGIELKITCRDVQYGWLQTDSS